MVDISSVNTILSKTPTNVCLQAQNTHSLLLHTGTPPPGAAALRYGTATVAVQASKSAAPLLQP